MKEDEEVKPPHKPSRTRKRPFWVWIVALAAIIVLGIGTYTGYTYAVSPATIRNPTLEHYHFRMQILVNGKAQDFSAHTYQEGYSKDSCTAGLTAHPIHFHDNKDQFVHIHWEGMTGGLVMKYYGWNYIGGSDSTLGYRFDELPGVKKVGIHGKNLPAVPKEAKFYVYIGDQNGYIEKDFAAWKAQSLETFFGKNSNYPGQGQKPTSLIDKLFPRAYAHPGHTHSGTPTSAGGEENEEQRLTRLNNLIGNVVIFVQKDRPTNAQINERFNKLEPLSDSTCGG